MSTFKEMGRDGTIKRADAHRIKYADIHVRPGFNLRDINAADFQEDLDALVAHMAKGGRVPDLEVVPRDEGGVWLVDGHRRHMAYGRLIENGQPIEWIPVIQFIGNDMQQAARILTSQEGRKLKPLEVAEGYRRLVAFGLSPEDVARHVGKTRQHVDQLLILANAPHDVHKMVAGGDVSATTAVDTVRKHGSKAAGMLADAKAKTGKGKVTAAAVKPWTPPAKVVAPTLTALESFLASINTEDRMKIENKTPGNDNAVMMVNLSELHDLFKSFNAIEDARKAADEKQRAKQAKAGQAQIAGTEGA